MSGDDAVGVTWTLPSRIWPGLLGALASAQDELWVCRAGKELVQGTTGVCNWELILFSTIFIFELNCKLKRNVKTLAISTGFSSVFLILCSNWELRGALQRQWRTDQHGWRHAGPDLRSVEAAALLEVPKVGLDWMCFQRMNLDNSRPSNNFPIFNPI